MCLQLSIVFSLDGVEEEWQCATPCHAMLCMLRPWLPFFFRAESKGPFHVPELFCRGDQQAHKWSLIILTVDLSLVFVLQMNKVIQKRVCRRKSFITSKLTPAAFSLFVWEQMSWKRRKENMLLFFSRGIKSTKSHGPISLHSLIRLFFSGLFSSLIYI